MSYDRRLAVVVPYRDRAEHLAQLVPHLRAYFERDKLDRRIDWTLHVVEQAGGGPFNRGKLKNVGFALARERSDYVVFHDVDYLPIWADYSYAERPARLIWHGLTLKESYEDFFGAVVLFPNAIFERVNGYSNGYEGWGFEDSEILLRLRLAGLSFERRDGTYLALPHPHAGIRDGRPTAEALANQRRFRERRARVTELAREDGLADLSFGLEESGPLRLGGQVQPRVLHHRVAI